MQKILSQIFMCLLLLVLVGAAAGTAQAQYGDFLSHYTLDNEFEGTDYAMQFLSFQDAQDAIATASIGGIERLGFIVPDENTPEKSETPIPVNDVRIVAVDGTVICASTVANGCNGFRLFLPKTLTLNRPLRW